jgi:Fur family ferric uptake transcriptional regulator
VFEVNEGLHHDHIVCMDCGRVEEFSDQGIEQRQHSIAAELGFELKDHALTLHGHCVRENCPHRSAKR